MRYFKISCLAVLMSASSATAATFSAYEASALASFSLVSARYLSTGADALDALVLDYYWDQPQVSFGSGNGSGEITSFNYSSLLQPTFDYTLGTRVTGTADTTVTEGFYYEFNQRTSILHYEAGGCDDTFFRPNTCAEFDPILVQIAYNIATEEASEGDASATAWANVRASYFNGPEEYSTSFQLDPLWMTVAEINGNARASGTYSFFLQGGSALGFGFNTVAQGEATHAPPSPVPVPPAVAMMGSGLLLLGFLKGRRRRNGTA